MLFWNSAPDLPLDLHIPSCRELGREAGSTCVTGLRCPASVEASVPGESKDGAC